MRFFLVFELILILVRGIMMKECLLNEIVFITGATSGFGEEIARLCVERGAKVVITGRNESKLKELQDEFGLDKACYLEFDVGDRKAVESVIKTLPDAFKDVTVLVNNAGLALGLCSAQKAEVDDWEKMVDTNIKGVMYCTHALLPGMVARNKGYIVMISSIAANYCYTGGMFMGQQKLL